MMNTTIGTDIKLAKQLLESGALVAIPTETVYGLAGNALNEDAVLKIFAAKERPRFNPLIVHVASWPMVGNFAEHIPVEAQKLAAHFTPGPLTFLLHKKRDVISDLVTAGSEKVAVRIPGHPLTIQLLKALNFPLAAPSANRFGYVSPVTAQHVYDGLHGRIPYILDGGPCEVGVESTIVDFVNDEVIVRRTGKVSVADIEAVLGTKVFIQTSEDDHPVAPGMLKSHYATHKPLYLGHLNELNSQLQDKSRIIIAWGSEAEIREQTAVSNSDKNVLVISLSFEKNIEEVAKKLFATMRDADEMAGDVILVQPFPDHGIGMAVNDRLLRAATNKNL